MSQGMARIVFIILTLAFAAPASAQGSQPPAAPPLEDMARAMREALEAFSEQIAPWAEQLGRLLDDPGAYQAPELLPNGDIIIRRKPDAPPRDPAPGLDL